MSIEELEDSFEAIRHLITSQEWRTWVKFKQERKRHFQAKVNSAIDRKKFDDAMIFRGLMNEIDREISLFSTEPGRIAIEINTNKQQNKKPRR